jgi:hypothetical protein
LQLADAPADHQRALFDDALEGRFADWSGHARNAVSSMPAPPRLEPMAQVRCEVGVLVSLGPAKYGERRYVPLLGGTVTGPELNGMVVAGGVDWQVNRADGVLDIAAHYVIRAADGALIEVQSDGMRHGSADVMARLGRGEPVARDAYFFRTLMRFQTGALAWAHLNKVMAIAVGQREAQLVVLDVYRIT